jgi:hypothetical protein
MLAVTTLMYRHRYQLTHLRTPLNYTVCAKGNGLRAEASTARDRIVEPQH